MISTGEREFLLFAITPPRASSSTERRQAIADATLRRLRSVDPDGVILYDIAEEHDRNADERPFPFLPTVDPADYLADHLSGWDKPTVVYRSVGKLLRVRLPGLAGDAADRQRALGAGGIVVQPEHRTDVIALGLRVAGDRAAGADDRWRGDSGTACCQGRRA